MDYNADGERVHKGTTKYFGPLFELQYRSRDDASGRVTTVEDPIKYYFAGPQLVDRTDADSARHWYHQDRLGSTRVVTNETCGAEDEFD